MGNSISEGIGQGRITENLRGFKPDYCFQISDDVMIKTHISNLTIKMLDML